MTAVRTSGEPCRAGEFRVASASRPGTSYLVVWVNAEHVWCGCPSFQHRQRCRHTAEVAAAVEAEDDESVQLGREAAAARLHEIERFFAR